MICKEIVNSLAKAAISFVLQINIKKTECMIQPISGTVNAGKDIFVNGEALKRVSSLRGYPLSLTLPVFFQRIVLLIRTLLHVCKKQIERMAHFNQHYMESTRNKN